MKNKVLMATTFIFLTLADQIIKHIIVSTDPLLNIGILTIRQVHNTGASFGMFKGNNFILAIISLIIFTAIIYNFRKLPQQYLLPTSLLSSGIIGNLIDRIFRGHVVDMIDFGWFPVFNIADTCIFIGIAWICVLILKEDFADKKITKSKTEQLNKKRKKIKLSK